MWFGLPAADTSRARSSCGDLFGWQFQPHEDQCYHMTYEAGGAIVPWPEESGPTVFFGVEELDAAIARVRELVAGPVRGSRSPGSATTPSARTPRATRSGCTNRIVIPSGV